MFTGINVGIFNSPDFKEDSVRETIITPILSKLGYSPSGTARVIRSKTLKHPFIRVGTRNHPITTIPDYILLHEDKIIFVLDAKGPTESVIDKNHVQQAYSYAIHPEIKCQEFGLCNGRQLAVFNIDNPEPILLLNFEDYETNWINIEKHLLPKYLLMPELRNFEPDFGYKLSRLGIDGDTHLIMQDVRLNLFGKVNESLVTASANIDIAGIPHCASFDFPYSMLSKVIAGLPKQLSDEFCSALNRAPFQAAAGLTIEIDLTATLGGETQGKNEKFIPLLIQEIHDSRFNPSDDPNDVSYDVFQLRNAFKIRSLGNQDA